MFWNPTSKESPPLFPERKEQSIVIKGPTYPTCDVCGVSQHDLVEFKHKDAERYIQITLVIPLCICRRCLQKGLDLPSKTTCERCGR